MAFWDVLGSFLNSPAGGSVIRLGTDAIASGIQRGAVNRATQAQQQGIQRAQAVQQPYNEAGQQAVTRLNDILAQPAAPFQFDPSKIQMDGGVQFRIDQARKAIQASQAARLASGGGAAARELEQEIQNVASSEYGAAFQREFNSQLQAYNSMTGGRQQQINGLLSILGQGSGAASRMADMELAGGEVAGQGYLGRGAVTSGQARRAGNAADPFTRMVDDVTYDEVSAMRKPRTRRSRIYDIQM